MRIKRFVGARSQRNLQTILRYLYLSLRTLGRNVIYWLCNMLRGMIAYYFTCLAPSQGEVVTSGTYTKRQESREPTTGGYGSVP